MLKTRIFTISLIALTLLPAFSQDFSSEDYNKAGWMTTRFYGAQRSGLNNWTIYNHLPDGVPERYRGTSHIDDSDGTYDLSGGWNDCGDHVKFGQTQYYSGYMLLKAYDEFPTGYDDLYSHDYAGYNSSEDYDWESGKGQPNGIPDILDEVKHATDYFIKCAKSSTEFYYQVGNGGSGGTGGDHTHRVTSVLSQTLADNEGGQNRPIGKNPSDGRMPALCAASLALMSRVYAKYDSEYAALCLTHAKNAYDYAAAHKGESAGTAFGGFYGSSDRPTNEHAIMLAEMYWATGEEGYRTEALAMNAGTNNQEVSPNTYYTFDYSNTGELALYVLGELGNSSAKSALETHLNNKFVAGTNYNGEGVYKNGGSWGKLRYVGNAGFLAALYSKMTNSSLNAKVYDNVDYVMGSNNNNLSFIAGFETNGVTSVKKPHHRNVYRNDEYLGNSDNTLSIEANNGRNFQFGALVGGSLSSSGYSDVWSEYVNTEVCIDYNAGLVGALGAIKAELDPVDTNKFNAGSKPDLGDDQSICGVSSITLDSKIDVDNVKQFTWYKDEQVVQARSKSGNTLNVTQAGVYKCVIDSLDEWETSDAVTILGELPSVDLGDDVELCKPSIVTLATSVVGNGVSYNWTRDGEGLDETTAYIDVSVAGTYRLTINASGCSSKFDEVIVTSLLPEVEDGYGCNSDIELSVLSPGGPFEWYSTLEGGNAEHVGSAYMVSPNETTTYYVKDAGSVEVRVGPMSAPCSGTVQEGTRTEQKITAYANATLVSTKIVQSNYGGSGTQDFQFELWSDNNNVPGVKLKDGVVTTVEKPGSNEKEEIEINIGIDIEGTTEGTSYWLKMKNGGVIAYQGCSANYDGNGNGVVDIVGARNDNNTTSNYGALFDLVATTGSDCDRTPVKAIVDCVLETPAGLSEEMIQAVVFPNPFVDVLNIGEGIFDVQLINANGSVVFSESQVSGGIDLSSLPKGIYQVVLNSGSDVATGMVVKQ